MSSEGPAHERRRANRMSATFLVRIAGVDREPVERRGDISRTGLYVECDQEVGRPGSVQALLIALPHQAIMVHALARVVRVASIDDLYEGTTVLGLAFEFLLADSDEPVTGSYDKERAEQTLRRLVRAVAARHLTRETLELNRPIEARVSGAGDEAEASVQDLDYGGLTLETTWHIPEGETIRIEVPSPDLTERVRLVGRARRTSPADDARFRVEVEVMGVDDSAASVAPPSIPPPSSPPASSETIWSTVGSSLGDVVGTLLDQALEPQTPVPSDRRQHLFGDLSRIALPTLLTLFETEKLEGVLQVRQADGPLMVYLKDGRIIDAEGRGRSARGAIQTLLRLREGEFEFTVESVDRADRFEMSITRLVLDMARELDEERRPEVDG